MTGPVIVVHLEDPAGSGRAACTGEPYHTTIGYNRTPRVFCTGCDLIVRQRRDIDPVVLAEALNATVGTNGWARTTPGDPVAEWLMNGELVAAAYRRIFAERPKP